MKNTGRSLALSLLVAAGVSGCIILPEPPIAIYPPGVVVTIGGHERGEYHHIHRDRKDRNKRWDRDDD